MTSDDHRWQPLSQPVFVQLFSPSALHPLYLYQPSLSASLHQNQELFAPICCILCSSGWRKFWTFSAQFYRTQFTVRRILYASHFPLVNEAKHHHHEIIMLFQFILRWKECSHNSCALAISNGRQKMKNQFDQRMSFTQLIDTIGGK